MWQQLVLVATGGALGSVLRYGAGLWVAQWHKGAFPLGTLLVNILGCFLIGLTIGFSSRYGWFTPNVRLLATTGFCGGFTTFSTFAAENVALLQSNQTAYFLVYTIVSVVVGLLAVWLGHWAAVK